MNPQGWLIRSGFLINDPINIAGGVTLVLPDHGMPDGV
jgi:hypothetical protein